MKFDTDFETIEFDEDGISEYIVMASAAGWYIGKIQKTTHGEPGVRETYDIVEPYDRYTGYGTVEEARTWLKEVDKDDVLPGRVEEVFGDLGAYSSRRWNIFADEL